MTWGDGHGALIDWSGITAVVVCLQCHTQLGPWFSAEEAKTGISVHRGLVHISLNHKTDVSAEAIAASRRVLCFDCNTRKAVSKWLCRSCEDKRIAEWLREQHLLAEDQTLNHYRKTLQPTYTSPRWAAFKPEPEPEAVDAGSHQAWIDHGLSVLPMPMRFVQGL
jgi:hypothetical protein